LSFDAFLEKKYVNACSILKENDRLDQEMVAGAKSRKIDDKITLLWMKNYGLFQGIGTTDREKISIAFRTWIENLPDSISGQSEASRRKDFHSLLQQLFLVVPRSWLSATSKLLWCVYPDDFVIYDSFVHRALVVISSLDDDLESFPKIGNAISCKRESDIQALVDHYMIYQTFVYRLLNRNQSTLNNLRKRYSESYPHDIRIVDKLLWAVGSADAKF
jgi:hypothetical protein